MGCRVEKIKELAPREHLEIHYAKDSDNIYGLWLSSLWWSESDLSRLEDAIRDFRKERLKI